MNVKTNKTVLYIFNGVIALICLVAIVGYFLAPLYSLKFKVDVRPEAILALAGEEKESAQFVSALADAAKDRDLSFDLALRVTGKDLLVTAFSPSPRPIYRMVDKGVSTLVEDFKSALKKLLPPAIDMMIGQIAQNALPHSASGVSEKDLQKINELLSAPEARRQVEEFVKELDEGSTTAKDAAEKFVEAYNGIAGKYEGTDGASLPLIDVNSEEVRNLEEMLGHFEDENGKLSMDGLLSYLAQIVLPEEVLNALEDGAPAGAPARTLSGALRGAPGKSVRADAGKEEGGSTIDDLADRLGSFVYGLLDRTAGMALIRIALILLALAFLLTLTIWLYPVLKIAGKIGEPNPGIYLTVPLVFGALPYLFLVLLPSIPALIVNRPQTVLAVGRMFSVDLSPALPFLQAFSVKIFSSSVIAFYCTLILFVILFVYAFFRRRAKRAAAGLPV